MVAKAIVSVTYDGDKTAAVEGPTPGASFLCVYVECDCGSALLKSPDDVFECTCEVESE